MALPIDVIYGIEKNTILYVRCRSILFGALILADVSSPGSEAMVAFVKVKHFA